MASMIKEKLLGPLIDLKRFLLRGAPQKPSVEVQGVLSQLQVMPKHLNTIYNVFSQLKQDEIGDSRTITTASEVSVDTLINLVPTRKRWVERCLRRLLEFGGCYDTCDWNNFLFIFLKFNSLSKVELCQTMFYIITKDVKSWTIHYLTCTQLQEYYTFFAECPVKSFCTKEISFSRLPLHRYYIADFVELCHRYSQLINPLVHLQRSVQQCLPAMQFWNDYDRIECYNRRISLEFFRIKQSNIFLRKEPSFQESGDFLIPDTLGGQVANPQQWNRRMGHYNFKEGVWPDFNEFAKRQKWNKSSQEKRLLPAGGEKDRGPIPGEEQDGALDDDPMMAALNGGNPVMGSGSGIGGAGVPSTTVLPGSGNPMVQSNRAELCGPGRISVPLDSSHKYIMDPDSGSAHSAAMFAGINNEQVRQPPMSCSSNQVQANIRRSFGGHEPGFAAARGPGIPGGPAGQDKTGMGRRNPGAGMDQYRDRVPRMVGNVTDLPKWMRNYVTLPQEKTEMQRIEEMGFIRSMRLSESRQDSLVNAQDRRGKVPLLPRPGQPPGLDKIKYRKPPEHQ